MSSDIAIDITDQQRFRLEMETSSISEPGTWSGTCDKCGEHYEEYIEHAGSCPGQERAASD